MDVQNQERLWTHRPAIFVANHQSSLDIPVLGRLLERDFTIVAKKEARWDPRAVVGSVVIDPAWIDRSDSESARATLDGVVDPDPLRHVADDLPQHARRRRCSARSARAPSTSPPRPA